MATASEAKAWTDEEIGSLSHGPWATSNTDKWRATLAQRDAEIATMYDALDLKAREHDDELRKLEREKDARILELEAQLEAQTERANRRDRDATEWDGNCAEVEARLAKERKAVDAALKAWDAVPEFCLEGFMFQTWDALVTAIDAVRESRKP